MPILEMRTTLSAPDAVSVGTSFEVSFTSEFTLKNLDRDVIRTMAKLALTTDRDVVLHESILWEIDIPSKKLYDGNISGSVELVWPFPEDFSISSVLLITEPFFGVCRSASHSVSICRL